MVLTPAAANFSKSSLKPSKIIPNLRNLFEIKLMPPDASLRVFSGRNCIRIPNKSANTKAPIILAYGSLAK